LKQADRAAHVARGITDRWRDGLLAEVDARDDPIGWPMRLCAALERAAQHDSRIKYRDAWETGLAGLAGAPGPAAKRGAARHEGLQTAFVARRLTARFRTLGMFADTWRLNRRAARFKRAAAGADVDLLRPSGSKARLST
jgi:hypothetical protein